MNALFHRERRQIEMYEEHLWSEFVRKVVSEFAMRGYNVHPDAVIVLHNHLLLRDDVIIWKTNPQAENGNLEDAIEGICKLKTDRDCIIYPRDVIKYFHLNKGDKRMWRKAKPSTFYKRCLSKKHDLTIHGVNFGLLYIKCNTCGIVWRFRIGITEWCTSDEWYEMGGK